MTTLDRQPDTIFDDPIRTVETETVIMPGNEYDIGIIARPLSTGFVAVDLGMGADPETFTGEVVQSERAGLPGWRWRKEYKRDFLAQSGLPVFETAWLDRHDQHITEPLYRMDLDEDGKTLVKRPNGRLRVWIEPKPVIAGDEMPSSVFSYRYSFGAGCDVSEGVEKSDSTIVGFRADTMEQAFEFNDNRIRPSSLGRFCMAVGLHFNEALFCVVRKLHGLTVLRTMLDGGYPYLWSDKIMDRRTVTNAAQMGWPKGEVSSPALFGKWQDLVENGKLILHSAELKRQHGEYIFDEMGKITHQRLANLPVELRHRHGDLVVGAALAFRACLDSPRFRAVKKRVYDPRSFEGAHERDFAQRRSTDRVKW